MEEGNSFLYVIFKFDKLEMVLNRHVGVGRKWRRVAGDLSGLFMITVTGKTMCVVGLV